MMAKHVEILRVTSEDSKCQEFKHLFQVLKNEIHVDRIKTFLKTITFLECCTLPFVSSSSDDNEDDSDDESDGSND